jgi:hypothetical protein
MRGHNDAATSIPGIACSQINRVLGWLVHRPDLLCSRSGDPLLATTAASTLS